MESRIFSPFVGLQKLVLAGESVITGSAALFLSHFYKKYNAHQGCRLQKYG
jgi:hypothetical protein